MNGVFQQSYEALAALLDHIPETLCVIDHLGAILYVNRHWKNFALENGATRQSNAWLGDNYLKNCRSAAEKGDGFAQVALTGISDVISGRHEEFSFEYPCHSDEEKRWFKMLTRGFQVDGHSFYLISHSNITERRSAEEVLIAQTRLDGLTNIANRRHFEQFLMMEWRRCARLQLPISVLLIDIDFFKQYNDKLGHLAGDHCLKQIARALNQLARRPSDLCARYGGEEFALVLGNSDYQHAEILAERVLTTVRELQLDHPGSTVAKHVTVSIGFATLLPGDRYEKERLLTYADQMLYGAKASGKDCLMGQEVYQ